MRDQKLLMLLIGGLAAAVYFLSKRRPPEPTKYTSFDASDISTAIGKGNFKLYSVDQEVCAQAGVGYPCYVIVYRNKQGVRVARYISQKDLEGLIVKAGKKVASIIEKAAKWLWGIIRPEKAKPTEAKPTAEGTTERVRQRRLISPEGLTGPTLTGSSGFRIPRLTNTSKS